MLRRPAPGDWPADADLVHARRLYVEHDLHVCVCQSGPFTERCVCELRTGRSASALLQCTIIPALQKRELRACVFLLLFCMQPCYSAARSKCIALRHVYAHLRSGAQRIILNDRFYFVVLVFYARARAHTHTTGRAFAVGLCASVFFVSRVSVRV